MQSIQAMRPTAPAHCPNPLKIYKPAPIAATKKPHLNQIYHFSDQLTAPG